MSSIQASGSGRISRRTLLKATTATAGAIATAAALAELETPAEAAAGFVKGVDISWVPQMEAPPRGCAGRWSPTWPVTRPCATSRPLRTPAAVR